MSQGSFYHPYSLTLLHEKANYGLSLCDIENEALSLPYPELPESIKWYKDRRPEEFKAKFVDNFQLQKIANYREYYTLATLLKIGAKRKQLSGFRHTEDEINYSRTIWRCKVYRYASLMSAIGAFACFRKVFLPLYSLSKFNKVLYFTGAVTSMLFGYSVLHRRRMNLIKQKYFYESRLIPQRKAELLKLRDDGVFKVPLDKLAEFPPNPLSVQLNIEAEKLAFIEKAWEKRGTIDEDFIAEGVRYPDTKHGGDLMIVTIDKRLKQTK